MAAIRTLVAPGLLAALLGACFDPHAAGPPAIHDVAASSEDDGAATSDGDIPATCGDATCDPDESCASCPADCGGCPAHCGDGVCDPDERCDSCTDDCGACVCGDGVCDGDEDWTSCFADCVDDAPLLSLVDIYPGCVGRDRLQDDGDADDWLWIRADTGALVYVAGGQAHEIADSSVRYGAIWIGEQHIGTIDCHASGPGSCAPVIAGAVWPDTGGEQVPCLAPTYYVLDAAFDGTAVNFTTADTFAGCASACGDGQCEGERACHDLGNLEHVCDADCGLPQGGCPACA